ncbi:MAG: hypothetical protein K6E38_05715 [Fretibacterium sp.]|nr:hypothetical protein [Fretibacterium sp.]
MRSKKIRPKTRELVLCLWENFTGVRSGKKAWRGRIACWIFLSVGISLAAAGYLHLMGLRETKRFAPSLPLAVLDAEKARLSALSDEMRLTVLQRGQSALRVQSMRERGKNPFSAPLFSQPPASPEPSVPEVTPPPEIVVKAVLKAGKNWAAVIDIAGGGNGLVVRPGDSFMDGKGKVVRIDGSGLVVRWNGREWNAVPGLF